MEVRDEVLVKLEKVSVRLDVVVIVLLVIVEELLLVVRVVTVEAVIV